METEITCEYPDDPCMHKMQLAQAYFVFQKYDCVFPPEEALCEGTIFPAFLGRKCVDFPDKERDDEHE